MKAAEKRFLFIALFVLAVMFSLCFNVSDAKAATSTKAKVKITTNNEAGKFTAKVTGLPSSFSSISSVKIAVWSENNGQDDIYWYTATKKSDGSYKLTKTLSKHKYDTGTYYYHVYVVTKSGKYKFACSGTAEFTASASKIKVSTTSTGYKIKTTGIVVPGGATSIKYAVWSKTGGKDDIKWFTGSYSNGSSSVSYKSSNFKKYGTYNVRVYAVNKSGKKVLIGSKTYKVNAPTADSVTVKATNASGKFKVTIKNVTSSVAIKSVKVAVWSENDGQDDIYWYTATAGSNGNYTLSKTLSKHKYDTGTYYFHVYAYDTNGTATLIGSTTAKYTASASSISVKTTSSGYKISASGIVVPGGVSSIKYAVWSKTDGQDDLQWFTGSYSDGSSSVSYKSTKFTKYGTYNVRMYAINTSGKKILVGSTTYKVNAPTAESVTVSTTNSSGKFTVSVNNVKFNGTVSAVKVAVWSSNDGKDDIQWYSATADSSGNYTVSKNISKHNYDTGTYNFNAYVYDANGTSTLVGSTTAKFTTSIGSITVSTTTTGFKISASKIVVPGGVSSMYYAVWSESGGQDDIKWYTGSYSDGSSSVTYNRSDFSKSGTYNVHVYAVNAAGTYLLLGNTTYTVESTATYDSYAASVMRNIIYAVETGGQIYGNARYDDFTASYTNSINEKAITIGAACWYGTNAKKLLVAIQEADPTLFKKLDTAGIAEDLENEDWTVYGSDGTTVSSISDGRSTRTITSGSDKAVAIQNIISSDVGIAVQDQLVETQLKAYIEAAAALGVSDLKAQMFCANLYHLGGKSGMTRVVNNCINDGLELTMENIWATMLAHDDQSSSGTQVGSPLYHTRHQKVMNWLNTYITD